MNIPGDFGAYINELKNASDSISNAVQRMGESINTFAQQTATINNDFANLRDDLTAQGDPERTYLFWNDENSMIFVYGKTKKVKRGSQTYKDLVSAG